MALRDRSAFAATTARSIAVAARDLWPYLTKGELLSEWFAATAGIEPGNAVRFDFGDGDFFQAAVLDWNPPTRLRLRWKFMGVGPAYRITFDLNARDDYTEVTVEDIGSLTQAEAEELRQGWDDFLSRLHDRVMTGANTRYAWSETICAAAYLPAHHHLDQLLHETKWAESFPDSATHINSTDRNRAILVFSDPLWAGLQTEAVLSIAPIAPTLLKVVHSGWKNLYSELQVQERRRYAGYWERFLSRLEQTSA